MSLPSVWLIYSLSYIYFKKEQKDCIWETPVFSIILFWCHSAYPFPHWCLFTFRHAECSHLVFVITTWFITVLRYSDKQLNEWALEGSITTESFFTSLKVCSHSYHSTKTNLLMSPKNLLHADSSNISGSWFSPPSFWQLQHLMDFLLKILS